MRHRIVTVTHAPTCRDGTVNVTNAQQPQILKNTLAVKGHRGLDTAVVDEALDFVIAVDIHDGKPRREGRIADGGVWVVEGLVPAVPRCDPGARLNHFGAARCGDASRRREPVGLVDFTILGMTLWVGGVHGVLGDLTAQAPVTVIALQDVPQRRAGCCDHRNLVCESSVG